MGNKTKIYDGTTFLDIDADTLDGKHASDFRNITDKISTADLTEPNVVNGVTPTSQGVIDTTSADRLAFLPAEQIIVEQSTDGGVTWVDAGISDTNKKMFFASRENITNINLPLKDGKKSCACMLRVTITGMKYNVPNGTTETEKYNYWNSTYVNTVERYFNPNLCNLWLSSNSDRIQLTIQKATGKNSNTWVTEGVYNKLSGWPGRNICKISGSSYFGGYVNQTNLHWNWRFIFRTQASDGSFDDAKLSTAYTTSQQKIKSMKLYSSTCDVKSNEMMYTNHIYDWDYNQNAIFPASITANNILPKSNNSYYLGLSNNQWLNAYIKNIYEDGTLLSNKYLGINSNAVSATKSNKLVSANTRPTSANFDHDYIENYVSQRLDIASTDMTTGKPTYDGFITTYFWDNNGIWDAQLFIPNQKYGRLQVRYSGGDSWGNSSWISIPYMSDIPNKVSQLTNDSNFVALVDNLIPSQYLPSYVDDVLEYENMAEIPQTGESGKIYVDKTTNKTYRWSGTTYVEISPSLALGETSSTAYAGDKGKANATAIETLKGYFNSDGVALRAVSDSVGNPITTSYVNLGTEQTISGDKTFSGYVKILGTAAERHLITRGIGGCRGDNPDDKDDLYVNFDTDYGLRFGKDGYGYLKSDGSIVTKSISCSGQITENGIALSSKYQEKGNYETKKTTTTIFNTLTSLGTNATAVGVFTTKSITLTDSVQSGDKLKVYLCGNSSYEQYCAGIIEFELYAPTSSKLVGSGMIMPTIGDQKFIVSASVTSTTSTSTSLSIVVYTLSARSGNTPAGANNVNVLKVERIR